MSRTTGWKTLHGGTEIKTPEELAQFADHYKLRSNWHEPDEQDVTARVDGDSFDNAMGVGVWPAFDGSLHQELTVVLMVDGVAVAKINLANLLAWATPERTP